MHDDARRGVSEATTGACAFDSAHRTALCPVRNVFVAGDNLVNGHTTNTGNTAINFTWSGSPGHPR